MQKITEIKEFYTEKRKQRVNGEAVFIEKKLYRFRDVNYVDGWARFGHWLLDYVFRVIFEAGIGIVLGVILALTQNLGILNDPNINIYNRLVSWLIFQPLYYFIFELAMQASPAKAILGRIVVDEYGNKPSPKQIFLRSISRVVPFEAFSCLSTLGWHDTWSNTFVIRKKDLKELKLLQKINNIEATSVSLPNET
ncbi:MAG: RDD family protein [Bacteroidetes bacterium]|nr:RDD family protein [Bacteroidota bacterium]